MSAICRGCGAPIVWAVLENGTKVPLDPKPPVYHTGTLRPDGGVNATRDREALVSHFATCPQANQFSGKGRKEKS